MERGRDEGRKKERGKKKKEEGAKMAGITTSDDRPKRGKSERRAKKKKEKEKENDREKKRQKNPECTDSLDRSSKG